MIIETLLIITLLLVIYLIVQQNRSRNYDDKDKDSDSNSDSNKNIERYLPDIDHDFDDNAGYRKDSDIVGDWAYMAARGLLPWWNSTRFTRNSSYDIRGDIPPILYDVGPWNISPILDRYAYQRY